jgi:hypothetical protein
MYTFEEIGVMSGLSVLGSCIIVWCCKMQWDQNALGKLIKKWKAAADGNEEQYRRIESKIEVMEAKYDFMCALVMDDVKNRRKDLFAHHSPLKPTPEAVALIPEDIMIVLREYNVIGANDECMMKAIYVSERVSVERLSAIAHEKELSLLEFMTLITEIEVGHG